MATYYLRSTGGNWNTADSWSTNSAKTSDRDTLDTAPAAPTASDDLIIDDYSCSISGTLTHSAAALAKSVNFTGFVGTYTPTNSLTVSGNVTFSSGMTYTLGQAYGITFNASSTLTTNTKNVGNLSLAGTGATLTLGSDVTLKNDKSCVVIIYPTSAGINLGSYTLSGYSSTSRILVRSNTLGTSAPLIINTGTFANADFKDVTFDNAGNDLDLSAITGLSGDCGGNSNSTGGKIVTFTTAETQTWSYGGTNRNWSTLNNWTTLGTRVPLPQDSVVLNDSSTITADMPRPCTDLSFASTNTAGVTKSINITIYGSLNLTNCASLAGTGFIIFESNLRSGTTNSITTNGLAVPYAIEIDAINTITELRDNFVMSTISTFNPYYGTFRDNGYNLTVGILYSTASYTRTIQKTGNWTITRTAAGNALDLTTTTGLTWSDTAGMIYISDVGANAKTFVGGGQSFNNLTIAGGGAGAVIISGSNTFNTITVGAPKTVTLTAGTTQQVANFIATGSSGSLIKINATAGVVPILNYTGAGKAQVCYTSIQGVNVTPANKWYYDSNSQDGVGLQFAGTGAAQYVVANNTNTNKITGSTIFSVEAWVLVRTAGNYPIFLSKAEDPTKKGYALLLSGTTAKPYWVVWNSTSLAGYTAASAISLNVLHHIVGTYNHATHTCKLYVDGSLLTGGTDTVGVGNINDDSSVSLVLGDSTSFLASQTLDGLLYLSRIYKDVELDATDVTALYNGGVLNKSLSNNATAKATQVWKLNEGTGDTKEGVNSDGVTGTITGALWANTGWNSSSNILLSNGQGVTVLTNPLGPAYTALVAQGWTASGGEVEQPTSGDFGV